MDLFDLSQSRLQSISSLHWQVATAKKLFPPSSHDSQNTDDHGYEFIRWQEPDYGRDLQMLRETRGMRCAFQGPKHVKQLGRLR